MTFQTLGPFSNSSVDSAGMSLWHELVLRPQTFTEKGTKYEKTLVKNEKCSCQSHDGFHLPKGRCFTNLCLINKRFMNAKVQDSEASVWSSHAVWQQLLWRTTEVMIYATKTSCPSGAQR